MSEEDVTAATSALLDTVKTYAGTLSAREAAALAGAGNSNLITLTADPAIDFGSARASLAVQLAVIDQLLRRAVTELGGDIEDETYHGFTVLVQRLFTDIDEAMFNE